MAKGSKRGLYATSTAAEQKYRRDQYAGQWRSGTHGIEYGAEEDVDARRNTEVARRKRCFYCRKLNAGHVARDCPQKKKRVGNGTGR